MRRCAERPGAPVDEGGPHAGGLGADAVEGVIGDKEDLSMATPRISAALR